MKRRLLLLSLTFFVSSCFADNPPTKKSKHFNSDKISIKLQTFDGDPGNFLRLHHFEVERDILISVKVDVKDITFIMISDINAKEDLCGRIHTVNVSSQRFDTPINIGEVFLRIGTPCLHKRSARLRLTVKTERAEYYREHTFPIHHLTNPNQFK